MRGQSAFASAPILGAERKRKSGDKQLSRQGDATGRPAAVGRREGLREGQERDRVLGLGRANAAGTVVALIDTDVCWRCVLVLEEEGAQRMYAVWFRIAS